MPYFIYYQKIIEGLNFYFCGLHIALNTLITATFGN